MSVRGITIALCDGLRFSVAEIFRSVRNRLEPRLLERTDAVRLLEYCDVIEFSGLQRSEGEPSERIGIKRSDGIARCICTVKCDKSVLDRLVTGIYNGACKGRALLWGKRNGCMNNFV